ncbi:DUF6624 domain-containing protein [Streptomyces sp. NPDC048290]|uniref:DUF6624 domain-containing protein n=1 Tax=Streptomyces sp. NPDC048290 TaxID=3155811 RepID=UPI003428D216
MTQVPVNPALARELADRAGQSIPRWAGRVCGDLGPDLLRQVRRADQVHARFLRQVLDKFRWPGWRLVGDDACHAAYLLALHADDDPRLQATAATLLHEAVRAGDASPRDLAHLKDRALVNSHQPQEFGTQYRLGAGGPERCPVSQPALLDARRAGAGLSPAARALAALQERIASGPGPRSCLPGDGSAVLDAAADAA